MSTPALREQNRRSFIANAIEVLNRSLDYEQTLGSLAWIAVPAIADWCAVDMLEAGTLQRLAVAHADPAQIALAMEIERRFPPDMNAATGIPMVLRTGQPDMVSKITPAMIDRGPGPPELKQMLQQLGLRAYICVPLRRGGETLGTITLIMAESARHYDESDLALAVTLADRAAVAVENARLFREAVRARERLEEARAQAELANRAKDEFLAMLGHELRNPLAPILTALDLMELRDPHAFVRERTVISRQLRHVVRLVDDLLDVSRITRSGVELAREELDLAEAITKGIELASPVLEERGHQLVTSVEHGLMVHADPVRLAQVAANLITNAAKYTEPRGTITITAALDQDRIALRVRDTGVGIAADVLPRVFETFYQTRQSIERARGGLGLGLAIVRSLVEAHGGEVAAYSDGLGTGSEFVVWLPRSDASVPARPSITTVREGARPLRREAVLVVDDNLDALQLLAEAIEERGFQTLRAHDAPSALALARHHLPALALVDVGLPVMDGYELGRQLRAIAGLEHLHLVAVTGYGQASDRAQSTAAGFAAHLVKPIALDIVYATIDRLLPSPT